MMQVVTKIIKKDENDQKMAQIGPKWSKIGPKRAKIDQNWAKIEPKVNQK